MKRLVISEKSNAAARVATILSDGSAKRKSVHGVQVFNFERGEDEFYVVGLRGHIIELDYPPEFNDWNEGGPDRAGPNAEPAKRVTALNILHTLSELSQECDEVIIATDFDREGELIGLETVTLLDKMPQHPPKGQVQRSDQVRDRGRLQAADRTRPPAGRIRRDQAGHRPGLGSRAHPVHIIGQRPDGQ